MYTFFIEIVLKPVELRQLGHLIIKNSVEDFLFGRCISNSIDNLKHITRKPIQRHSTENWIAIVDHSSAASRCERRILLCHEGINISIRWESETNRNFIFHISGSCNFAKLNFILRWRVRRIIDNWKQFAYNHYIFVWEKSGRTFNTSFVCRVFVNFVILSGQSKSTQTCILINSQKKTDESIVRFCTIIFRCRTEMKQEKKSSFSMP